MTQSVPDDSYHPQSIADWRAWLEAHHTQPQGVWVLTWGRSAERNGVGYEDLVCEALCFGWIDGQTDKCEDGRTMQRFSPRRRQSTWAKSNKARVERLIAEGRMTPAGMAEVERAKAGGRWTLLEDAENLVLPDDLAAALDALPPARAVYEAYPASEKRAVLSLIAQAKQPATRAKRVQETVERAQRGERLPRLQPKR